MNELELRHHGVKGQKWGVRRYQNPDGTLTEAGKKRQNKRDEKWTKRTVSRRVYNKTWIKSVKKFNSELSEINKQLKPPKNKISYTEAELKKVNEHYRKRFNDIMSMTVGEVGKSAKSPSGRYEVDMFVENLSARPVMALIDNDTDRVTVVEY